MITSDVFNDCKKEIKIYDTLYNVTTTTNDKYKKITYTENQEYNTLDILYSSCLEINFPSIKIDDEYFDNVDLYLSEEFLNIMIRKFSIGSNIKDINGKEHYSTLCVADKDFFRCLQKCRLIKIKYDNDIKKYINK